MKVIFLDVDGVLNSEDDLKIYREQNGITGCIMYAEVEDRPLKLLKEIIEKNIRKDSSFFFLENWLREKWKRKCFRKRVV